MRWLIGWMSVGIGIGSGVIALAEGSLILVLFGLFMVVGGYLAASHPWLNRWVYM